MTTKAKQPPNPILPAEMADRFGPMLVKELRQGLRTKIFLTGFIGFQVILLIMVLTAFWSNDQNAISSGEFLNGVIWMLLMVMLMVITPLRGQFALEKELRTGSMELLQITNLNAWRIVRGKWSALVGEAMLYLAAALPYFTLRYFLGGVHILNDLGLLAIIALLSASLTAIVVGFSGFRSVLLRIALTIGIILLLPGSYNFYAAITFNIARDPTVGFSLGDWWESITAIVIMLVTIGWSALRLGARTIATQAENHSTFVRLLTLGSLIATVALGHIASPDDGAAGYIDASRGIIFFCGLVILVCGLFSALTDNSLQSSLVYKPFIKSRLTALGRIVLYPGWGAGFFYCVVMTIVVLCSEIVHLDEEGQYALIMILAAINFFLQPAVLTRWIIRNRRRTLGLSLYITMLVGISIVSGIMVVAESTITSVDPVLSTIFPIPAITVIDSHSSSIIAGFQLLSIIISTALLLPVAIEDINYTTWREKIARKVLENAAAAKTAPSANAPEPQEASAQAPQLPAESEPDPDPEET